MNNRSRIILTAIGTMLITVAAAVGVGFCLAPRSRTSPPSDLVLIPGGPFMMGSSSDDADAEPPHDVRLGPFYIDRYEVTNAQYARFLNATEGADYRCGGHVCLDTKLENPESHILSSSGRYVAEEGYDHHPVTNVSWYGARAYCSHFGLRLPTEAEWEKAARGTDGRRYPWGNTADPARLNADYRVGRTSPVGSYPDGASPYSVHDLAGNVWEWTADWYDAYPGNDSHNPLFGQKVKVVRGGSWNHPDSDARTAHRDIAHPTRRIHVVGFRCARDAE